MIGLDTNVLLRFVLRDDERQYAAARAVFASFTLERKGFLSLIVISEFSWVLGRTYKKTRSEIAASVEGLLRSVTIEVERLDVALLALQQFRASKADFPDCLISVVGKLSGCTHTFTFDVEASKLESMRLLQ